jgi:hypothetical protein
VIPEADWRFGKSSTNQFFCAKGEAFSGQVFLADEVAEKVLEYCQWIHVNNAAF